MRSNSSSSSTQSSLFAPALLLVCGPSGVGKGTLCQLLLSDAKLGHRFAFSVSHTSRFARPGEVDGQHYHFVSDAAFAEMARRGEFLEHTRAPHGVCYGTSAAELQRLAAQGKVALLDVDLEGVRSIRTAASAANAANADSAASAAQQAMDVRCVGVLPPGLGLGLAALEERLRARGTESEEQVVKRLARAEAEVRAIRDEEDPIMDARIVNGDSWEEGFPALKRMILEFWPNLAAR
jgi:guanylate kinase